MRSNKLILKIIRRKKEVYYPLFSISMSYLLCWIIMLFISFAYSQVVLPFLFWSIANLIFKCSLDIYHISKKSDDSVSKKLIFFLLFISLVINFIIVLILVFLVLLNIYYVIPISIYFLVSVLVFFILRKEVKKYYSKKKNQIVD